MSFSLCLGVSVARAARCPLPALCPLRVPPRRAPLPPLVAQVSGTLAVDGSRGARARRPRPWGVPHIYAENRGRSVLRAGIRAGAGPPVPDGSLAALGAGPAVRGARPELHRARCDDAAHAVPRRPRRRVGELRAGHEGDRRGASSAASTPGSALARGAAAGGVRPRRLDAGAVVGRRSAESHGCVRRERRRARRGLPRAAGRGRRRSRARASCCPATARIDGAARPRRRPRCRISSPRRSAAWARRHSFSAWRRR